MNVNKGQVMMLPVADTEHREMVSGWKNKSKGSVFFLENKSKGQVFSAWTNKIDPSCDDASREDECCGDVSALGSSTPIRAWKWHCKGQVFFVWTNKTNPSCGDASCYDE